MDSMDQYQYGSVMDVFYRYKLSSGYAMKCLHWHYVLFMMTTTTLVTPVLMPPPEDPPGVGVGHCLKEGGPVLPCLSAGAVDFLEEANQRGGLEVLEGLDLVQDDGQAARTIIPVGVCL